MFYFVVSDIRLHGFSKKKKNPVSSDFYVKLIFKIFYHMTSRLGVIYRHAIKSINL